MEKKISWAILFSKIFYKIFFLFFLSTLLLFSLNFSLNLSKFFFFLIGRGLFPIRVGKEVDFISLVFLSMVFLVTSLVTLYREVYIEGYNNKKFIALKLLFLVSIIILVLGRRPIVLMLGWDGLGISSLCLIIFYPNKISIYNSFLTFFFNRLGDVILIICLYYFFKDRITKNFSFTLDSNFLILILLCSFTKRAQFPLSSWLPAAISAPTPISAIVHSSTLVTAGIFLIWKFWEFLFTENLLIYLIFFSSTTFLIGGLLGRIDKDIKKVVAFSTMSQIRMILLFLSIGQLFLGGSHIFFHALFKTLLFCGCGLVFLHNLRDQSKKSSLVSPESILSHFFFFISLYCIRGLAFSSSFFSKDLALELTCSSYPSIIFFILILGSSLTILYSSKLFSSLFRLNSLYNSFYTIKFSSFPFLWVFTIFSLFCPLLTQKFFFFRFNYSVSSLDLYFLTFFLLIFLLYRYSFRKNLALLNWDLFFSKRFIFSKIGLVIRKNFYSVRFVDHLVFKPAMLGVRKELIKYNFSGIFRIISFFSLYFYFKILCFYSL